MFDPRDLISPPFESCPRCGEPTFGVLSISGTQYSRRCRACFETCSYPLWPVQKKVIYIDQFAISNMMKAIDVTAKGHDRTKADPLWLTLFETLERLCKLQLVICPSSDEHHKESIVSPFFEAAKRMYEQFSHGVSFHTAEKIAQMQLHVAAVSWLRGEQPEFDLNPKTVTYGGEGLHAWHDRVIISLRMTYPDQMVESIREFRDRLHDGVIRFFEVCRATSEKGYAYWFNRERNASRQAVLESVRLWQEGRLDSSYGLDRFHLLIAVFRRNGVPESDVGPRLRAFLESDAFKDFPASDIATRMWAVIAQKAANGQRKPPNQGTVNDINIVSALLPYCDAMFVDNKCRALLNDIPAEYAFTYPTRLFSPNTGSAFIAYLKDIEEHADTAILSQVRQVYGPDWPVPFLTMYEQEQRPTARNETGGEEPPGTEPA